jgi:hypothetical protein
MVLEGCKMRECDALAKCIFFNDQMASRPGTAELMKNNFCRSNYETCARYMVLKALGREAVPKDLFPSEEEKAKALLANHRKS